MHGENGTPVTPDWQASPGNTCGGCAASANLCWNLTLLDDQPCCDSCTHNRVTAGTSKVLLWEGDDG